MRLLIIDDPGAAIDVAVRAQLDGHEVKHYIRQTPKTEHIGDGLIDRVEDFREWTRWADLIFYADNARYLRDGDAIRAEGQLVCGPSALATLWESDRREGMKVFKHAGINVPPCKFFDDYDAALRYVKKENRRFVSKTGGENKALSYCAKTPADMVYMLERWKAKDALKEEFMLQDFKEGTEMAVGGWFGPEGFSIGWHENWEFKKLMNGDLGVATGEQGTVLRVVSKSKLADKVLIPLIPQLQALDYTGYIDVNCIIDDKGQPWPLEFTMRPGWPTLNLQLALVPEDQDFIEWLRNLCLGDESPIFSLNKVVIGVCVSIPDYPYSHLTRKEVRGVPIYGLTPSLSKHVHLCEVMEAVCPIDQKDGTVGRMPMMASAGDYLLVMTAVSETVQGARELVYDRLKRLSIPNSPMWRTDIGLRLSRQLPKLQSNGYAKGMNFSLPTT